MSGGACVVSFVPEGVVFIPSAGAARPSDVVLIQPAASAGPATWVLLAGRATDVRVNGSDLALGIRALQDKDEVTVAGHRLFFSTEQLAGVAPFAGSEQPAFCPRCKQRLERGEPAVRCPRCHAWHHQSERFPCWNYDSTCALCQEQLTALDAGYSWTPEDL
jgi:hypothetical protein